MRIFKPILCLPLVFAVFYSCTPSYQVFNVKYGDFFPEDLKTKSVRLVNEDNLLIGAYFKTFSKNFKTKDEYVNYLSAQLINQVNKQHTFNEIKIDKSKDWKHLKTLSSKKSYLKIDSLFNMSKTDLVLSISRIQIGNNQRYSSPIYDINSGTYYNTISSNNLEMFVDFKLYDVETRKLILEYTVTDSYGFSFWNYSDVFITLTKDLSKEAVSYLKMYK